MGTKTVDETGVKTDEDKTDEAAKAPEKAGTETADAETPAGDDAGTDDAAAEDAAADDVAKDDVTGAAGNEGPTGVGQGAGAVVSAGLGIVSLTGSWVGTVASARESLIGQLETSSSSDVGMLIEKGYGNAWHATALWGGLFALVALIVGVVVLARPAFGAPGRPQAPWIKSVAWAGVALGVIGLLLAVLKYTDILLGLPSTG
ncbi:hypothetical protein RI578_11920 [Streptomyces sp. BB1-1-1]|uniref:hypothetical protein n=1 Tax=Streptomyces sp. BB1-1-1 TaxID=3074430 RepID=UPI002877967D|nr:hypothetical protein [Streptomyces sp. BB1-1-1]WND34942.1 hypothetical protein RI578_11920 [Streptomyces sp. BB1-1-1]